MIRPCRGGTRDVQEKHSRAASIAHAAETAALLPQETRASRQPCGLGRQRPAGGGREVTNV